MIFIFRNRTIFWDISKWNRRQKKWDGGSRQIRQILIVFLFFFHKIFFNWIFNQYPKNTREHFLIIKTKIPKYNIQILKNTILVLAINVVLASQYNIKSLILVFASQKPFFFPFVSILEQSLSYSILQLDNTIHFFLGGNRWPYYICIAS